jgi:hypothetical protein
MHYARRSALIVAATGLVSLVTALGGAAASAYPAAGVKGDPQPGLKPFKIGASTSGGTVAMEQDGSLVVVYDIGPGDGKTRVCVLKRAAHTCSNSIDLVPLSSDSVFGTPQVLVDATDEVDVLQQTCCDSHISGSGDDLLARWPNGATAFTSTTRVGKLPVSAAALVGQNIAFTADDDTSGAQVESISTIATGPPPSIATATTKTAADAGVSSYRPSTSSPQYSVLIASDHLTTDYTTYAEYAPAGDDFNRTSSYTSVGTFAKEQFIGISGNALLTEQTTGKQTLEVRFFKGSGFGAAHAVPGSSGGGPEAFAIDQDPAGVTHVFGSRGLASKTYHLLEYSTTNGSHWTGPVDLGKAVQSNSFAVALDKQGSGLVLGTGPAWGYPVLAGQSVSFTLKSDRIGKGKSATGSGKVSPVSVGRDVTLQVERHGLWFSLATTHEKSGGAFSFKIKGSSAGTFHYRAVAAGRAGYALLGYSASRILHVTS